MVATPNGLVKSCGGAVTAGAGSSTISLTGGMLAAAASCTIKFNVQGKTSGLMNNTTGVIGSTEGGVGTTSNTATLSVTPPLIVSTDDKNGNCLVITFPCTGTVGNYCWRAPNGTKFTGPCTLTVNGSVVQVTSTAADLNLLQGEVNLSRFTAQLRLSAPRTGGGTSSVPLTITDSDTRNSTCSCP